MFDKLLIANRGEIACRIIRTARKMGLATVAVHSDADANALHVRSADEAVHIGPPPAAESYLVGERIIAAAKQTGAQAIHPGYGFLSENAGFAEAVQEAGLIWVGAPPSSIRAMGLKDAAKKLMRGAGVPVTPGYDGEDQSAERLKQEADAIGYPVLIKAVAGGGGKGMRKVDAAADFDAALQSCRREAKASFGNDDVILEKWITSPRHIEVQVFGDSHGNVVHLFERDCSLQRRHQKVIEEAPAPGMDEATREEICAAAVRAAKAVDYEGAGTIEFIADASEGLRADRIFFMEMNTRLQVEHPVTEEITGVDLVEWQLRVAAGEAIPLSQDDLAIEGHAIEARLYAEDPSSGFLPSTGPLDHFDLGTRGRIETGVSEGDTISPDYDPMIAKLVVWRETREDAVEALADICEGVEVWPVKTNAAFLANALLEDDFLEGHLDTGFIERKLERLVGDAEPNDAIWQAAADFTVLDAIDDTAPAASGFRLNADPRIAATLFHKGESRTLAVTGERDAAHATGFVEDTRTLVFADGQSFEFAREARGGGAAAAGDGAILAPMPGKVLSVDVAEGDTVEAGQRLLVLEAMKMEHALTAPFDGVVADLSASEGAQVQVETLLVRVEAAK
ncbi:acetyl/propionyl/methylcrotonyl-CoA carboxylase subunit alpha [Aurantiacibacter spongiae]|uniref:Acetyl/propionyl/methylcrotonyl-CoA carboxylase subunit alpha n=1 Tax=Aurantiacibacter spongiae TaxID=2488860 RepID=A0A3N5CX71_9SPHN|nr:acetyl/propionyl/methylcrotonyl-CoA carboxylase subunit alpha [Aurantiacibacter spongiae]RPF72180.1 acetyl/propionyl/methylcrotonyl-CoA carboxylase subunit alpha [Aurantiacibacter spongiae]